MWDSHPRLRKRARTRELLVVDARGRKHVSPTLSNLHVNSSVVRPFTLVMAKHGVIITKSLSKLRPPIEAFYRQELVDEESKDPIVLARLTSSAKKTAKIVKTMLTAVKRKWSKWEMPRETKPHIYFFRFLFGSIHISTRSCVHVCTRNI